MEALDAASSVVANLVRRGKKRRIKVMVFVSLTCQAMGLKDRKAPIRDLIHREPPETWTISGRIRRIESAILRTSYGKAKI